MEPVTHFLTGACLARTGFNRKTALATLTMTLAAEAPDIDLVAYIKGPVYGFAQHRGATHTVWGIPLLSALLVLAIFAGHRLWRRWRPGEAPHSRPRWGLLFAFACIAGYSHLLLDYTNNYGIRPFWPWWPKWYAWDIVFIIEPVILVVLIGGLTLPALFVAVRQEIGARSVSRGRLGAALALLLVIAVWGVRDYEHRRALHAMDAFAYHGQVPLRISALPYMVNPFVWYGIADTGESYTAMLVDSLTPAVDPQDRARRYYKPDATPASRVASATYLGRAYLDWARYPLVETGKPGGEEAGYEVRFRDLRFMYPDSRRTALGAYVLLSPNLQVEEAGFAPSGITRRMALPAKH